MAMILVVSLMTLITLIPLATVTAALLQAPIARNDQDRQSALAAAEAGVEDYINRLNQNPNYWTYTTAASSPDQNQAFDTTAWQPVVPGPQRAGDPGYHYSVDNFYVVNYQATSPNPSTNFGTVYLTSTGQAGKVTRTIEVGLRQSGFLDSLSLSDINIVDPSMQTIKNPATGLPDAAYTAAHCGLHAYDPNPLGRGGYGPDSGACDNLLNYWITGQILDGPIRTNDEFYLNGTPQFHGPLGTADPNGGAPNRDDRPYWLDPAGNTANDRPVFQQGGPVNVGSVTFPPSNGALASHAVLGSSGCIYYGPTVVQLNGTTMTVVSPDTNPTSTNPGCLGTNVALPADGVIYVQSIAPPCYVDVSSWTSPGPGLPGDTCGSGDVFVKGTLDGQLTIGAANNIFATGSLTYASFAGGDVLGLISNNFVLINHPPASALDGSGNVTFSPTASPWGLSASVTFPGKIPTMVLDAAVLSVNHSLGTSNFGSGFIGNLTINGSLSGKYMDIEGTFGNGGGASSGYNEFYNYDARLSHLTPPFFLVPGNTTWRRTGFVEPLPGGAGTPQVPAFTSANSTTLTAASAGSFAVTASGSPTPGYTETGALPTGVTFNTASGLLSGNPVATSGGTYPLTFTATNIAGTATQTFTLTVEQAPAFTSAATTVFASGTPGTFAVAATGFPAATFTETGALPSGVTLSSGGVLSGTPAAGTGGTYPITITATNTAGTPTQAFTLTVNQAPVFSSPNSTAFAVGGAGTFTVTASATPAATFTEAGALPAGVTLTASGVLSGTAATAGSFPITITAANGIAPNATQAFTLTVSQAPVFTSASSTTFTTGAASSFTVTANGTPAPVFTETGTLPAGVTLSSAGVLAGTPGAATGRSYPITITAANGINPNGIQSFSLTVNQASAFTSVNFLTVPSGTGFGLTVTTSGFPVPVLTASGLPAGVSFLDNGNNTATVTGTAAVVQGIYTLTFTATSAAGTSTQAFTLTETHAPAFTSATSTTFSTGIAGTFTVATTGTPASTFTESGALPAGVTLTSAGVLSGTPGALAGGVYPIIITATNGIAPNATQAFTLSVNQAPAFTSPNATAVASGTGFGFTVTSTGVPVPVLTASGLPAGVTFVNNGNHTATLSGTAAVLQGIYTLTFTATSAAGTATQTFTLTETHAPAFTSATSTTFTTGTAGTFTVTASGTPASSFTETGALPAGVTLTSAGVLSGTPGALAGGVYPIIITATNGIAPNATQAFTLSVNQAPAFTSPNATAVASGTGFGFTVTSTGVPVPVLTASGLPAGVTFVNNGNNTATLSGTAAVLQGIYTLTFTATSAAGTATQTFTLTETHAPAFTSATSTTFTTGTAGTFTVTASGTPASSFTETGALPAGVTLTSAGVLSGTPGALAGGVYPIIITATNGIAPNATQAFTLSVNQAPVFTSATSTTFTAGAAGSFTVIATGTPAPTFTEIGALPAGVTLTAAGVLAGTPGAAAGGSYPITITAANGVIPNATQAFTLTVNQAPAFTSANATTVASGTGFSFTVTTTGFPVPVLTASGLPAGVTFVNNGNNTATLTGTNAVVQGIYALTLTATSAAGSATQGFTLTETHAPAFTSGTSTTFTAGTAGTFTVIATGTPAPTFTEIGALPAGVTLTAAGVLAGTPGAAAGGSYPITITATNGIAPNATQAFTLTVNQAPLFTSPTFVTVPSGTGVVFTVTTTGFPVPVLTASGLPAGVTFVNNGNNTATLTGTNAVVQGIYPLTFTATSTVGTVIQGFTLTETHAPVFTTATSSTFTSGNAGTFNVAATGTPAPAFTETGTLPAGVSLSTAGVLSGTPAAGSGGAYAITITASNGINPNATQAFTLKVNQAPAFTSATSAAFSAGTAGTFTVTASGAPAPTFTETGALPPGVTLSSGGVLSGIPAVNTGGGYPVTITATNGVNPTATQSFTLVVNLGQPSMLAFTTLAQSMDSGSVANGGGSGTITVQVQDQNGNALDMTSPTVINLAYGPPVSGGTFAATFGGGSITSITVPTGSSSANFYFTDTNNTCQTSGCTPTITASRSGLTSATQTEFVNGFPNGGPPPVSTTVTVGAQSPSAVTPGQTATFSITVVNSGSRTRSYSITGVGGLPLGAGGSISGSNCQTGGSGTYTFTGSVTTTAGTPAGVSSMVVVATRYTSSCGGSVDENGEGKGTLTISPGPLSALAITSAPVSGAAGTRPGPTIVKLTDQYGNPVTSATATTVNLNSSSVGGTFFASSSGGAAVTSVVIPANTPFITFYYSDTIAGTPVITATSGAMTDYQGATIT